MKKSDSSVQNDLEHAARAFQSGEVARAVEILKNLPSAEARIKALDFADLIRAELEK